MIIKAKYIPKGRKKHQCNHCNQPIIDDKVELFGMAHYHEKPSTIYVCRHHMIGSRNSQIKEALQELNNER